MDIQKYLFYSSQFFLGMGFMLSFFISLAGKPQNKKTKTVILYVVLSAVFLSQVVLYLFIAHQEEIILWSMVERNMVKAFIIITAFIMLTAEKKHADDKNIDGLYIMLFALSAATLYNNIVILIAAFITFDFTCFLNVIGVKNDKKFILAKNKYFYFIGILFFTGIFVTFCDNARYARIAMTAIIMFLIFFSTPASLVLLKGFTGEVKAGEGKNFTGFMVLCTAGEAVIIYRAAALYPGFVTIEALLPVILAFLCLSALNTITEEKYFAFAANDLINAFLLTAAFAVALKPQAGEIIAVIILILISGIILAVFLDDAGNRTGEYKVSDVRYNFKKIKNNFWLLISMASILALEIYIFAMFYLRFKARPFILAIAFFGGTIYAINILNKIFILLSMIKRTDRQIIKNSLNSGITLKIVLFAALIAALAIRVII